MEMERNPGVELSKDRKRNREGEDWHGDGDLKKKNQIIKSVNTQDQILFSSKDFSI